MKTFQQFLEKKDIEKKSWSKEEAKAIGNKIGIDWDKFDVTEFQMGLVVEKEHDTDDKKTDLASSEEDLGKIAFAHLKELKNYYTKLKKAEG